MVHTYHLREHGNPPETRRGVTSHLTDFFFFFLILLGIRVKKAYTFVCVPVLRLTLPTGLGLDTINGAHQPFRQHVARNPLGTRCGVTSHPTDLADLDQPQRLPSWLGLARSRVGLGWGLGRLLQEGVATWSFFMVITGWSG